MKTYRELRDWINSFSEEQKDMPVLVWDKRYEEMHTLPSYTGFNIQGNPRALDAEEEDEEDEMGFNRAEGAVYYNEEVGDDVEVENGHPFFWIS